MNRQQISRRRALGGLTALAAVPAISNRIRAGSDEAISAGVLTEATGGGHIRQLLQGLASARGVARVAVSDPAGKRFDQAEAILGNRLQGRYRSHRELLRKARPQLVVVILEGHHSPPAIRMALEAGSHVITEKPGCARLEDFEPLAPLARLERDRRVDPPRRRRRARGLRSPEVRRAVGDLSLQVGEVHRVVVDNADAPDAGRGKVQHQR